MDWLKELLKAAGVEESKIDSLIGDVNKELPKHFVPKSQYNESAEAKKKAEKEVADRDKQLEDLKKSSGDADALRAQIDKLQGENKTAKEQYESKLKDLKLDAAIAKELEESQAKHSDLLAGKIDREKLELLDDGTVKGLADQIKTLQESYKDLFGSEEGQGSGFKFKGFAPPEGGSGGAGGPSGSKDQAVDFAKRVAEFAKNNSQTSEAQKTYFGE